MDTSGASLSDVATLVARVPAWTGRHLTIQTLHGGITNRNHVVTADHERFVVRIPGEQTDVLGIDRAHEAEAARRAAELGIAPEVIGDLPGVGTLITRLVDARAADGHGIVAHLEEVIDLIRRFHHSGELRGRFPVHRVVEWHARDAAAREVVPPSAYERLHQQSRRIEAAFDAFPDPLAPCHNDLLPANVLIGDERVWLIDFEYAGMNDAVFDLANLSVNCGFQQHDDEAMLRHYFGEVTARYWARLQLMKLMSEFREGMWSVVQQAISTLDTDFVAYAGERFETAERLAARPEFSIWLDQAATPR